MKIEETIGPKENPMRGLEEVVSDFAGFGGGTLISFIGTEYATARYMEGVKPENVENAERISIALKIIGSLAIFGLTSKYINNEFGRKFMYGVGSGIFTSAGSDIVNIISK